MANEMRSGWAAAAAMCGFVWLGYAAVVHSDKNHVADGTQVIYPPNQAVLLSGNFDVIAKAPGDNLTLNGRKLAVEAFEAPVRVAHVGLSPGWHELRVGEKLIEFVVALNEEEHDGPAEWHIHRRHPMGTDGSRCAECHKTETHHDRTFVGELRSHKACLECHDSDDVQATHSHPLEPLESCQTCHAVHSSSGPSLLKAPAKELCLTCHNPEELGP